MAPQNLHFFDSKQPHSSKVYHVRRVEHDFHYLSRARYFKKKSEPKNKGSNISSTHEHLYHLTRVRSVRVSGGERSAGESIFLRDRDQKCKFSTCGILCSFNFHSNKIPANKCVGGGAQEKERKSRKILGKKLWVVGVFEGGGVV